MTLFCRHRVNLPSDLAGVPREFGVEIDLRSWGGDLHLEHDAFVRGPSFDEWLDAYAHAFIVLNVKEEGLETAIVRKLEERGITEWAFLDQSFPSLVRTLRSGDTRTMVRVSEYETPRTALSLDPRPDWVWLDSFTGRYPDAGVISELAAGGFRFMVVSPELQGRPPQEEIMIVKALFDSADVPLHAVCTKNPAAWT